MMVPLFSAGDLLSTCACRAFALSALGLRGSPALHSGTFIDWMCTGS